MRSHLVPGITLLVSVGASDPALAQQHGAAAPNIAKPNMVLQQIVEGLPTDDKQTVRVMTATFKPGDKTVYHTHRFPVTVYVLEGAFTLEMEGREPVTVHAGQAMVEPSGIRMTGYNRSADAPLRVVVVYVTEPGMPFLDPIH